MLFRSRTLSLEYVSLSLPYNAYLTSNHSPASPLPESTRTSLSLDSDSLLSSGSVLVHVLRTDDFRTLLLSALVDPTDPKRSIRLDAFARPLRPRTLYPPRPRDPG